MSDRDAALALSARQASRLLGISPDTILNAIGIGELRASRLGKRRYTILRRDLDEWLERHVVNPSSHAESIVDRVLAREGRGA